MIDGLECALGKTAELQWQPPQPGDVPQTWANVEKAHALLGYDPRTASIDGVRRFAAWHQAVATESDRIAHTH